MWPLRYVAHTVPDVSASCNILIHSRSTSAARLLNKLMLSLQTVRAERHL